MIRRSYHIDPRHVEFTQQQLSVGAAAVLMLIFSAFMAGYFFSPKEEISFEDGVLSFFTLVQEPLTYTTTSSNETALAENESSLASKEAHAGTAQAHDEALDSQSAVMSKLEKRNQQKLYYAQLVRFGTLDAAQKCAQKLKRFSVDTLVVTKESTTALGKTHQWYQLISLPQEQKKALETIKRAQNMLGIKEFALIEQRKTKAEGESDD